MTQLTLFDDMDDSHDTRPLPMIVAANYKFALQTLEKDGVTYYAVLDWVRGVARADNASRMWTDLKAIAKKGGRDTYDSVVSMSYVRSDGRRFPADYADEKTLYQIVQYMRSDTGIRDQLIKYLAQAGVVLDWVRRDARAADTLKDSLDKHHEKARKDGIKGRTDMTEALYDTHVHHAPDYARVTSTEYETLFGAGKRELCRMLAIPDDSRSLRDNLNTYALLALMTAETHAAELMRKLVRKLTTDEQIAIARDVCAKTRPFFDDMAGQVGLSLTDKRVTK